MKIIIKILAFCLLAQAANAQCDTTGILLELQATTNLQGILLANDRCLTTVTVLAPLYINGDTLSIDTTGLGGGGSAIGLDTLVAIPPAAGFTIAGSPAQNSRDTLTFSLANDLAALEALSDTGIVVRTGTETYALRKAVAGTGISITNGSGVSGNPTITNTGDLSTTNEVQTYAHTGTASYTNTLSLGGGSFTLNAAGILAISHAAGTVTLTATEAQVANNGLSDNENSSNFRLGNRYMDGSDGLFSNDRKINLNAFRLFIGDNTDSTLLHVDGTNDRVGIHTTAPGRTFTVNGEAEIKDLVTTNPTLLVGADGNGVLSEVTLGGGLSFSGTTLNVSAGSNYQTWRDDGVAATQRPNANFVSTATVTMTLTDDAVNTETEVTANVPTDGITATQIAAGAVGTSEIATGGVATVDIADQAVTYVKMQNAAANNVLLGNNNGAGTSYEELNAAAVQTMLGYIDGNLVAGGRVAYSSDANTLTTEAAFLYDAANDRMTINCDLPGLGAGAAILNLANVGTDGTGEFLRMAGSIDGNMIAGMYNSSTTASDNTLFTISQAGNSAGNPILQLQISGTGGNTTSIGLKNDNVNKFMISPNANNVGANANASFVATNDAIPLWGINTDSPGRMLDVDGDVRAKNIVNTSAPPTASLLGTGLGTGGTVDAITGGNNGFTVSFTVGTAPVANGDLFRLTFANPFTITSHVVMNFNRDVDTIAERDKFLINGTSPGFISLKANGTMTASTSHIIVFQVMGQ